MFTIYIDLDHTLLDTEELKHAFVLAVKPFGISKQEFFRAYARFRKGRPFAIAPFVRMLFKDAVMQKKASEAFASEALHADRFLYSDAQPFLRLMKRRHARVVIFTYGDKNFQKIKIESIIRLCPWIDQVVVTNRATKQILLPRYQGNAVIIDNRLDVVDYFAKCYGMTPVVLDRPPSPVLRTPSPAGRGEGERHYRSLSAVAKMLERKGFI